MPAVTQRIDNYLGGVSRQSDDKKLPGQVRECLNGYPDPTFGLTKRPGLKWIANLGTGTTYDNSKWFYINRTEDEKYIGCITPKPDSGYGDIDIWNIDGTACTVTLDTSTSVNAENYLTGTRVNYDVLTVQDTSIISNNLITCAKQADPTFNAKRKATLVLSGTPASNVYTVIIQSNTITHTSNANGTYDSILTALKTAIDNLGLSGVTTAKYLESLQITDSNSSIQIAASGGPGGDSIRVFQDQVDNVSQLPIESFHGHTVKVINTSSTDDTYFAKFIADDGTSGAGYWGETIDPAQSPGLNAATMPHELVNTALNQFTFRQVTWIDRLVGDDNTNSHPSFVGQEIQQAFFYNNRLGFLSKDNVSMSQSQDFYNFYHTSAQTVTDADPIDVSCSTTRPAALHAVLPTIQGLILFSKNQQFLLSSGDQVLTPATTNVRTIANYEMATEVDPVDIGTNIHFIAKTPSYTRTFYMLTRGQDESPQILDIGRVVNEWVPSTIDTLVASPQNSFLGMSDQTSRYVYFFRTYNDGKENKVEAWFNWQMCGTVQTIAADSDDLYTVTKQGNQFTLSVASMSQSPTDAIIVNNDGSRINPCMDLYSTANSSQYKSVESITITAGGSGYSSAPTVTIAGTIGANSGNPGSGAAATATVAGGAVTSITLNNGGLGFTNGAVVSFSGGGGSGATATAAVYDGTKVYTRWNNDANLTPALIIKGEATTGALVESGFSINPGRSSDGLGPYFKVPRKDLSSVAGDIIVGWRYNFDITLPKTYLRPDDKMEITDFTASLIINRMKFAVGLSGGIGFKLKSTGIYAGTKDYTGDGSTTVFSWTADDISYIDDDQIKVKINDAETTAFTVSAENQITFTNAPASGDKILIYLDEWYNIKPTIMADTYKGNDVALSDQSVVTIPIHQRTDNFQLRIFNDSPFPVSLNSMMWEGHYSPRFYRRS